nr:hypothetical protein [uncultured Flavobacterium sp.]
MADFFELLFDLLEVSDLPRRKKQKSDFTQFLLTGVSLLAVLWLIYRKDLLAVKETYPFVAVLCTVPLLLSVGLIYVLHKSGVVNNISVTQYFLAVVCCALLFTTVLVECNHVFQVMT